MVDRNLLEQAATDTAKMIRREIWKLITMKKFVD